MSKKYSAHLVLWFLIQLLTKVECQTTLFKPIQRRGHTATLIDDKLYILGGRNKDYPEVGNEFFYTDVSVPFNTKNILWNDLTSINAVPKHNAAASVRGGANNKTLFLYGGLPYADNEVTMSLVYTFDTLSNSWSIPTINGGNTIRKDNLKAIVDDNGKMYLFGGQSNETITNDMLILDTINLKWGIGSSINAPSPRVVYGATYVSNQFLLYIGGFISSGTDGVSLSLKEIYFYDMVKNTRETSGSIPSDRDAFSAVLALDGQQVIIFGGTNNLNNLKPQEALYVLNLANYEWYIPKITGIIPGSRYWHKANVIGRYMVISFGFSYDKNVDKDILLLNISNNEEYMWTNYFDPNVPTTVASKVTTNSSTTATPTNVSSGISIPIIVGATVAILLDAIFLLLGGFYFYKWKKNKKENICAIPTSGHAGDIDFNKEASTFPIMRSVNNSRKERISAIPANNAYYYEQKPLPIPENIYGYGQQTVPIHENNNSIAISSGNNQRSSEQHIDLENLKNDIIQVV
ncbi:18809_t:CDS:2, partial [Funneliformis geosporum]